MRDDMTKIRLREEQVKMAETLHRNRVEEYAQNFGQVLAGPFTPQVQYAIQAQHATQGVPSSSTGPMGPVQVQPYALPQYASQGVPSSTGSMGPPQVPLQIPQYALQGVSSSSTGSMGSAQAPMLAIGSAKRRSRSQHAPIAERPMDPEIAGGHIMYMKDSDWKRAQKPTLITQLLHRGIPLDAIATLHLPELKAMMLLRKDRNDLGM